ncbi:MAG: maleylacetoacetate isomerase [Pseudomonadota bacterium]|uniref:Maleylacetoacetate isomerase n=1 Tax=Gallaecimonas pentaromativorans TaxID=584787 RepID=A0A3N1PM96_9GAMM|nr:maleylacetoacetate isomerase [Gallaecimonas pentaromativorans]MED5524065.1 maleylacetoacetate isomerase [Pseudomonadota bacterium]ROQ29825.1 maleylacetoacetate isomerase [Gallaecimonas pentaromativorans]
MTLYGYWRSSAAYRVRIAMAIKGIDCEQRAVHLVKDGGEQHGPVYRALNPAELVPTLVDGELVLSQSLAIMEYLEETQGGPALLPSNPAERARVRAFCQDIACDIHPVNNLRVLQYLQGELGLSDGQKDDWYRHWLAVGFRALEQRLEASAGRYAFGDTLTLADCCLVPQVYNARRFKVDMAPYPTLNAVCARLEALDAFIAAAPEHQLDAH